MRPDRDAKMRHYTTLGFLTLMCMLLGWWHSGTREPTFFERAGARLLDAAGEEVMARAAGRVRESLRHRFRGSAILEENQQLSEELILRREVSLRLDEATVQPVRIPGFETTRDRLVRLVQRSASAPVVGRGRDVWSQALILGIGRAHNVRVDDPVIHGPYLVGVVARANRRTCAVRPIAHPDTEVSVQCMRSEEWLGTAHGTPQGFLRLPQAPRNADIREGDTICTASVPRGMPGGLVVGTVHSYRRPAGDAGEDDPDTTVEIRPAISLGNLEAARVLRLRPEQGS